MYTRKVTVTPSDVACNGRIKLRRLLDYFQDTAGMAVVDVEGTTTELLSRGYAWVLMKYEIDFHGELPSLDETFTINTFHDPNHGYNTLRMFQTEFVSAKTSWLLVDINTGRPVKPVAHIPGITSRDNQEISPDFTEIPAINSVTDRAEFPVMFHDTDYNGHVNNAIYFQWIHDLMPIREYTKICASFRSGARLGENVALEFQQLQDCTLCRLLRPGKDKPCASFMFTWRDDNCPIIS